MSIEHAPGPFYNVAVQASELMAERDRLRAEVTILRAALEAIDAQREIINVMRVALLNCAFSLESYMHQTGSNAGKLNLDAARAALASGKP